MEYKIIIFKRSQEYNGALDVWQNLWRVLMVRVPHDLSLLIAHGYLLFIAAPLAAHLEAQNVEFIQFAFRWMNCLLMREISVKNTIRMWDTYLVSPLCGLFDCYLALLTITCLVGRS
jgi:hypothetical protein